MDRASRAAKPKKRTDSPKGSQETEPQDSDQLEHVTGNQEEFIRNLDAALKAQNIKSAFTQIFDEHCEKILKPLVSEEVKNQLHPVNAQLGEIKTDIISNKENIEGLVHDLEVNKDMSSKIHKKLADKSEEMSSRLLIMERAAKACNLVIVGLPPLPPTAEPEQNEAEAAAVSSTPPSIHERLINQVCDTLNAAGFKNVSTEQFLSAYIIKSQGQSSRVLCKLTSEQYKMNIFRQKKLLKHCSSRLYLNEDLTKTDGKIYANARLHVKEGILHSTWSKGGVIYAKRSENGVPFVVTET